MQQKNSSNRLTIVIRSKCVHQITRVQTKAQIVSYWIHWQLAAISFNAEFFANLIKAAETLNSIVEALLTQIEVQIRILGLYFNHYQDKFHTSYGILFLELRAPAMMRLHHGRTGMFKMRDFANNYFWWQPMNR